MGLRSLASVVLLAIPVGITISILLGLDARRAALGQQPLFQDNSINHDQYCQKAYGISPPSKGQTYTLNPNQWGWNPGDAGSLCMNVTTFNNNTYPTNTTAPQFSVTWQYPQGPETQPVHAFPNIKLDANADGIMSNKFPTAIHSIDTMNVDVEWTYGLGTKAVNATDIPGLTAALVNTNVAIDMFLDADKIKSQSSTDAKFEVMVWLCTIGTATQPIGYAQGAITSQIVNGTTFNMYFGQNGLGQYVLTWVAAQAVEKFIGDISPLLTTIPSLGQTEYPAASDYLGYMGLGSEALWTPQQVTFDVSHLTMDVRSK